MKALYCVTLALALTACNGVNVASKDDSDHRTAGSPSQTEQTGKAESPRLALDLPKDMKSDKEDQEDVKEWEHYEEMSDDLRGLRLDCDGIQIRKKSDLEGHVRGVFEVAIYSKTDLYRDLPSVMTDDDYKEDGYEKGEVDGDSEGEEYSWTDGESVSESYATYAFPFTCLGRAYLTLDVEASTSYFVDVKLLTSDLELAYVGSTSFDSSDDEAVLQMERVSNEARQTRIAIEFGDK